jgi:hypothetical protein
MWDDCQATPEPERHYGYLTAVHGLVAVWTAEGREIDGLAGLCACSG